MLVSGVLWEWGIVSQSKVHEDLSASERVSTMATGDRSALGIKNSSQVQHLAFGKPLVNSSLSKWPEEVTDGYDDLISQ